jgi:hypothetical protein
MTFEEFAAVRLGALLRFAGVLTGDRALAEDVVQEALIRARALGVDRGPGPARSLRPQDGGQRRPRRPAPPSRTRTMGPASRS